jgi:hypothetical protein
VLHPHPPPRSSVTPSRVDSNTEAGAAPTPASPFFRYAVPHRLEHGGGCCTHTRLPVLPLHRPASTRPRRRVLHPHPPPRYTVPRRLEHGGGCCTHTCLPVTPSRVDSNTEAGAAPTPASPLHRPASTRTRRRVLHPHPPPRPSLLSVVTRTWQRGIPPTPVAPFVPPSFLQPHERGGVVFHPHPLPHSSLPPSCSHTNAAGPSFPCLTFVIPPASRRPMASAVCSCEARGMLGPSCEGFQLPED